MTAAVTAASSSDKQDPTTQDPKTQETQTPNQETPDPPPPAQETETPDPEEEDEGECGFCLFMKGGECRDTFINWEKCVEEGEKGDEDIVNKCADVTSALKKCMEAHTDYYGVILQAEKDLEQEAEELVVAEDGLDSSDKKPKAEQE